MVKGTKEYYEMIQEFEKFVKQTSYINNYRLDKAENAPSSLIYDDGCTNAMFHSYMVGYQHGRANGWES